MRSLTSETKSLSLLSPLLSGLEAQQMGLMTRAVPAASVIDEAMALGAQLAAGPTLTLGRIKQNIAKAESGGNLAECLDQEAHNHTLSSLTEDHREAAAAFVEKRKPVFKGT